MWVEVNRFMLLTNTGKLICLTVRRRSGAFLPRSVQVMLTVQAMLLMLPRR